MGEEGALHGRHLLVVQGVSSSHFGAVKPSLPRQFFKVDMFTPCRTRRHAVITTATTRSL